MRIITKLCRLLAAMTMSVLLTVPVFAEEMTLEQAQQEINRLESENRTLKQQLEDLQAEIESFREKVEQHEMQNVSLEKEPD